ncbi:PAS domain-containing hybrid sensor histidine kinase/response regulator [Derxia lacustris]|uniref:PAS domain-containing hybrid sensor histidine kinase/response regulator n=1 Tax=Derxia lacustris TaxID=764842 RepID=UPI000A1752DA|nr:PAS domain S-box protein [Derxia lacustris]
MDDSSLPEPALDDLLASLPGLALLLVDAGGHIRRFGAGAEALFRVEAGAMLDRPAELTWPLRDVASQLPQRLRAQALAGDRVEYQGWRARPDGSHFLGLTRMAPLRGQPGWTVETLRDLSEPAPVRAPGGSDEHFASALVASNMVGGWDWDPAADRITANGRLAALFGVDAHDAARGVPLQRFLDAIHADDRARIEAVVAHSLATGALFAEEYRVTDADGELRWVFARGRCEYDGAGQPSRFPGAIVDITDRKRAEIGLRATTERNRAVELLEAEKARLQAVLSHAPVGIVFADAESGQILAGNRRAEEILGHPILRTPDYEGYPRWGLLDAAGQPVPPERFPIARAMLAAEVTPPETYQYLRGDGRRVWIGLNAAPVFDRDGRLMAGVVTITDIDDQMRARAALARFGEELEQQVAARTAELSAANRRLRDEMVERQRAEELLRQSQKMEAVGQLTGGIAHDFNNLLTGILGSLTLMRKRMLAGRHDEAERFIASASQSAHRAAALVQRLLSFSRQQALDPRPVDIDALVRSLIDLFRRTLGEHIAVRTRLGAAPTLAWSDENQLEAALVNLVINARDAMPDGGELAIATAVQRVTTDAAGDPFATQPGQPRRRAGDFVPPTDLAPGDYLRLAVTDTGCGMAPEVLAHAFEPFFTTKPVGQGTGLGLSMVYGFARQSGGAVRIESQPGKGSTVALWLPCPPAGAAAADPAEPAAAAAAPSCGSVLLVEDDDAVRRMVEGLLADLGLRVLAAGAGDAALALVDAGVPIDLLVSDIGLPGLDGHQLAAEVRQRRPGLPVLLMTGYAERAEALPARCEIIAKPFDAERLAAQVRRLLAGG